MAVLKGSNTFGTHLNELLTVKSIDKKFFSSILNINRTQLYRFLNGEQIPDIELVQKMAIKLNLRASEYDKMLESYECSVYGVEVIHGRKIIYNILDRLINQKKDGMINLTCSLDNNYLPPCNSNSKSAQIIPLQSKNNVLRTYLSFLDSIKDSGSKLRMIMQPDCEGLLDILPSILEYISKNRIDVCIEHIIRFKDITLDRNKLYNLNIIEKLLPLSKYEAIYQVYYSVGNYDTVTYDSLFPNLLCLDNRTALTISSDLESAFLFCSNATNTVSLLCSEFDKILKDCLPLFIKITDIIGLSKYLLEFEAPAQSDTYLLHSEHVLYSFPLETIEAKAKEHKVPDNITSIMLKRANAFRERLKGNHAHEVITPTGLNNFVETGRFFIQDYVYFDISQRIKILENLVDLVENNDNYNLYIMKEDNSFIHLDSAVYIIDEELLYLIPSYNNYNMRNNIIIRERGIIESFKDFFISYFTDRNCIKDQKTVAGIMKEKIKLLQDM